MSRTDSRPAATDSSAAAANRASSAARAAADTGGEAVAIGTAVSAAPPLPPSLGWLTGLNSRLSRWAMYLACFCLAGLLAVVVYGVVQRYVFNDSPPYVEQVALLLVISVAMFGAAAGVRDAGHIGLDSAVQMLSARLQRWCSLGVHLLALLFGVLLLLGSLEMGLSTHGSLIPTLGVSEAWRYLPVLLGGFLISAFSVEHLVALLAGTKVIRSWH